jgi:hypothetical protein
MGKQVNFFMLPSDEERFIAHIYNLSGVIVPHVQHTEELKEVAVPLPASDIGRASEMDIVQKDAFDLVTFDRIEKQDIWLINEFKSPVIQFRRSKVIDGKLLRGRIWAEMYDDGAFWPVPVNRIQYKGKEFERFYDSIARWIRRNFKLDPEWKMYLGDAASEWRDSGGELTQI